MSRQNASLADFQQILTPQNVRPLQIIFAALVWGVVLFAGVIFFLYSTGSGQSDPESLRLVQTMSIVHVLLALTIYPLTNIVYRMVVVSGGKKAAKVEGEQAAMAHLMQIRSAEIVRMAMYEGVAMLGLVVCLIAITNGVLYDHPIYWLNMVTSLAMVGFAALNFPNSDRLEQTFREYIDVQR